MAKLYIANTSKQNAQFTARLPESNQPLRRPIASGRQDIVYDGELYVIEEIIKQNEIYGLKRASEVARTKKFTGLAYQIDKPITIENFMIAEETNYEIKAEEGAETRKKAALYAGVVAENAAQMTGGEVKKSQVVIQDLSKDNPEFGKEIYSAERPDGVQEAKPRARKRK